MPSPKAMTPEVTTTLAIWSHWTRVDSGHTYTHSACLKEEKLPATDDKNWQTIHQKVKTAIAYILEKTKMQVVAGIATIEAQ